MAAINLGQLPIEVGVFCPSAATKTFRADFCSRVCTRTHACYLKIKFMKRVAAYAAAAVGLLGDLVCVCAHARVNERV